MIAGHIFNYGRVLPVEELTAKLEAVDASAVRRYGARTMTATQKPAIVTVGPAGKLERYEIFAGVSVRGRSCTPRNETRSHGLHARADVSRGQHPVIRGKDVYLRYPRIADSSLGTGARPRAGNSRALELPGQ